MYISAGSIPPKYAQFSMQSTQAATLKFLLFILFSFHNIDYTTKYANVCTYVHMYESDFAD